MHGGESLRSQLSFLYLTYTRMQGIAHNKAMAKVRDLIHNVGQLLILCSSCAQRGESLITRQSFAQLQFRLF